MNGGRRLWFMEGICKAFLMIRIYVSFVISQSYAIAASTIGIFLAIPRSGEKGSTLQVLPVDSNIKAYLPSTTIFAWLSSSDVELSLSAEVLTSEIIAFSICLLGITSFKE